MRRDEVLRQLTTPLGAPAYPPGAPYRFTDREYLNIVYRTDPEAMRAVVPEPLTVGDPLVKFEVMRMPNVTGLGSFTESGQVLRVEYEGQPADYLHAMYVDSLASTSCRLRSAVDLGCFPVFEHCRRLAVDCCGPMTAPFQRYEARTSTQRAPRCCTRFHPTRAKQGSSAANACQRSHNKDD